MQGVVLLHPAFLPPFKEPTLDTRELAQEQQRLHELGADCSCRVLEHDIEDLKTTLQEANRDLTRAREKVERAREHAYELTELFCFGMPPEECNQEYRWAVQQRIRAEIVRDNFHRYVARVTAELPDAQRKARKTAERIKVFEHAILVTEGEDTRSDVQTWLKAQRVKRGEWTRATHVEELTEDCATPIIGTKHTVYYFKNGNVAMLFKLTFA